MVAEKRTGRFGAKICTPSESRYEPGCSAVRPATASESPLEELLELDELLELADEPLLELALELVLETEVDPVEPKLPALDEEESLALEVALDPTSEEPEEPAEEEEESDDVDALEPELPSEIEEELDDEDEEELDASEPIDEDEEEDEVVP